MPLLLSLAWRSSASRTQRSALTIVAVALGVGLILATQVTASTLQDQLKKQAEAQIGHADAEVFAFVETGFTPAMVKAIAKLPEVRVDAPLVSKRVTAVLDRTKSSYTFALFGVDPAVEPRLHPLPLAQGQMLGAAERNTVLLDASWAKEHGVAVGDTVHLFTALGPDQFHVKGLLAPTAFSQESFGAVAFVPLANAQRAFRLGSRVTQVSVQLHAPSQYAAFREDLRRKAVEEYSVRDNHAFVASERQPYLEIQPVLVFFSLLTLGLGLLLIYNNLAVTVLERRREIGLLRAAGALSSWIARLFLTQALILGVIGSAGGLVVGLLLSVALTWYLQQVGGQGPLSLTLDPLVFAGSFVLGVLVALAAGVLPARRAAGLAPLEALRPPQLYMQERSRVAWLLAGLALLVLGALAFFAAFATSDSSSGLSSGALALVAVGLVLVFAGVLALTPFLVRPLTAIVARPLAILSPGETALARNALVRRPNRTALTLSGLLVSVALVVSVAGLSQGAMAAGDQWVNSLFVSDRLVVSPVHQTDAVRADFARLSGIAATSPVSFFTLRSTDRAVNVASIDPLDYSSRSRLEFLDGDRQTAFIQLEESRSVFVSRKLAEQRGLHVGSYLIMGGAGPEVAYKVIAVLTHSLPSPGGEEAALISTNNAREDFGVTGFNLLQVIPASPTPSGFDEALARQAAQYGMEPESLADVRAGVERGLAALLFLLTAVGLAGVVLGLLAVVTTILLNISESAREFGLLRAVGLTREQLRGLILVQSGLLATGGVVLGVAIGLGLLLVMLRAGGSPGFAPAYVVPWLVIVAVVVAALAGALLAVVLPASRAARQSVVTAVRYE